MKGWHHEPIRTRVPDDLDGWEKLIVEQYGKPCPDFGGIECPCCFVWALFHFAREQSQDAEAQFYDAKERSND